jgi:hypothetical protein
VPALFSLTACLNNEGDAALLKGDYTGDTDARTDSIKRIRKNSPRTYNLLYFLLCFMDAAARFLGAGNSIPSNYHYYQLSGSLRGS